MTTRTLPGVREKGGPLVDWLKTVLSEGDTPEVEERGGSRETRKTMFCDKEFLKQIRGRLPITQRVPSLTK